AFMVAAALCGLAGALVAQQNQYFNSDFITFHLSVFIFARKGHAFCFRGVPPCRWIDPAACCCALPFSPGSALP
ncbi:hypothetical protein AZ25_3404, partial [Bordetella holmesii 04P3421]